MDNNTDIGNRLKQIRKSLDYSQKVFAETISTSLRAYQYYERGKRSLSKEVIESLMSKFNINPAWLLSGEGFRYQKPKNSNKKQTVIYPRDMFFICGMLTYAIDKKGYRIVLDAELAFFSAIIYNRISEFLYDMDVFRDVARDEANKLVELLMNGADPSDPFSDMYLYENEEQEVGLIENYNMSEDLVKKIKEDGVERKRKKEEYFRSREEI
ncbi:MAG: helix-turn-helix domain-containing protein [Magnetococcus sp. DMHC-1]